MRRALRLASMTTVCCLLAVSCSGSDDGVKRSSATRDTTETGPDDTDSGTQTSSATEFSTDRIADDADVVTGTLDNGLTYYIRENTTPGQNAELRLAIRAGSLAETDEQAGVAHFVEHMLFNGTEKYPHNELVKVLESFGMTFGADLNAYTSFDETVYQLSVPLNDDANFTTALDVLAEWLGQATMAEDDVVAERGVVLDEWRNTRTGDGRYYEAVEHFFLDGTPADGKDPIGNDAAIGAMTPELVRSFYDTWYRPDNAAIVIVGDLNADDVEQQVTETFASIEARGESPDAPDITLEPYDTRSALSFHDPDLSWSAVEYALPIPATSAMSPADLAESISVGLALDVIATRLSDDVTKGDTPYTEAYVSNSGILRALDAPSIAASSSDEQVAESLDAVVTEIERAQRFGFGPNELDRAVTSMRTFADDAFDGRESTQDGVYADTYVEAFLAGTPYPDADTEHELISEILDAATPEGVAEAFARHVEASEPYVMVTAPDTAAIPTQDEILALLDDVAGRDLDARPDSELAGDELMTALPDPVEETSAEQPYSLPEEYQTPTVLTFPNGARVVLNETTIAEGSVTLQATSPGGMSLVADDDVEAALAATSVVLSSGLGELDQVGVEQVLTTAAVDLQPSIEATSDNFYGSANADDLEVLFQLLHLLMTAPRSTQAALDSYVEENGQTLEAVGSDMDLAVVFELLDARYGEQAARFGYLPDTAGLATLTPEHVLDVFSQRFSNAGDWVFSFSGDLDVAAATELAQRYIGSLETTGVTEQWVDLQPDPPEGVVTRDLLVGSGDTAQLTVLSTAPAPGGESDDLLAQILTSVLDTRLVDHLREKLGETYSPSSYVSVSSEPDAIVETSIQVSGAPDAMDRLATLLQDDLRSVAAEGPTAAEFDAAVEDIDTNLDYFSDSSLNYEFIDVLLYGATYEEYASASMRRQLKAVTAADITAFAKVALPADRYIQVIARPA